jgi:integrase
MAILVECPQCKNRNSSKASACKCGLNIKKASGKVYWIEFYLHGKRRRERIGPSKSAAEQRLREVLKARTEDKYIDKDPATRLTLGELSQWYLKLPEVKAKRSYRRDQELIRHLLRLLRETTKIKDLTLGKVESYQQQRLSEPSPRHLGENIRPATVNKEVICLKTIFNRAVRHGQLNINPVAGVRKLPENNVRMRILTQEEFQRLLDRCPDHLRPVILTAYFTGMRRSEVVGLLWSEIDFEKGFIRLPASRTKPKVARPVPIPPPVKNMLERLPRGLHTDRVFLRNGKPFDEIKRSYKTACRKACIEDFTFHDLRHCALNNLRLAGNDYFRIMAISGHKTMSVFKRYNLVTEDEFSQVIWPESVHIDGTMDTYMDTDEKKVTGENL